MVVSISTVAIAGTVATALMVVGTLALVVLTMTDENHAPNELLEEAKDVTEPTDGASEPTDAAGEETANRPGMLDIGRPDTNAAAGMIVVAIIVGAFLGFVLTFGNLIGAAVGAAVLVVVSIIYMVTFAEVPVEEEERAAH